MMQNYCTLARLCLLLLLAAATVQAQVYVQTSPADTTPANTPLTVGGPGNLTVPNLLTIGSDWTAVNISESNGILYLGVPTAPIFSELSNGGTVAGGTVIGVNGIQFLDPAVDPWSSWTPWSNSLISQQAGSLMIASSMGLNGIPQTPVAPGDITFYQANNANVVIADTNPAYAVPFFCASTNNDMVSIGSGPHSCQPFDILDVSSREAFGNGYMHWYADGVQYQYLYQSANPGWNAGISNFSNGVISFDTTTDGNGAATVKAGSIVFPDGTTLSTARPSSLSVTGAQSGFIASGENLGAVISSNPSALQAKYSLQNSGALLTGWNLSSGGGEQDLIANRGAGGTGGFRFYDYSSTGVLSPLLTMTGSGNVGIGTTTPGSTLEINGSVTLTRDSGASVTFQDGTAQATAWNGTLSSQDYAESVDVLGVRAEYDPGDVIAIDSISPGKFVKSEKAYSKLVAGVYSTKPGLLARNGTAERPDQVPMAMMGLVPVKVSDENGPIELGDLLVSSSTPGFAMKGTDAARLVGAVIGKAMVPLKLGTGVIQALITLQ